MSLSPVSCFCCCSFQTQYSIHISRSLNLQKLLLFIVSSGLTFYKSEHFICPFRRRLLYSGREVHVSTATLPLIKITYKTVMLHEGNQNQTIFNLCHFKLRFLSLYCSFFYRNTGWCVVQSMCCSWSVLQCNLRRRCKRLLMSD